MALPYGIEVMSSFGLPVARRAKRIPGTRCRFMVVRFGKECRCGLPGLITTEHYDYCQQHLEYLGSLGGLTIRFRQGELFE